MSEDNGSKIENNEDEEALDLQNEEVFLEHKKKFDDMQKHLKELKEENKRQLDLVMNSIDQLMADKHNVEQTLKEIQTFSQNDFSDELTDDIPDIPIDQAKNMNVIDILRQVTGLESATAALSISECLGSSKEKEKNTTASEEGKAEEAEPNASLNEIDNLLDTKDNDSKLLHSAEEKLKEGYEEAKESVNGLEKPLDESSKVEEKEKRNIKISLKK